MWQFVLLIPSCALRSEQLVWRKRDLKVASQELNVS